MGEPWTTEDVEKLKELIDKNYTKSKLMKALGRSRHAISVKVYKLGLVVYNTSDNKGSRGRAWRPEDIELLEKLWCDPKICRTTMCRELRRGWYAIRKKACLLGLGGRQYDTEYLSITTICEEMQLPEHRVRYWCKHGGLKYTEGKSGRTKYLVSADNLLKFLENHQDNFDASKISPYLFVDEPQWLQDKRKADMNRYPDNLFKDYTNEDDRKIQHLFNKGLSDAEIAKELNRTADSIKTRRLVLCLRRGKWDQDEVKILETYSRYLTVEEMTALLPRRTFKGVKAKCETMGIEYHLKKEMCKPMQNT